MGDDVRIIRAVEHDSHEVYAMLEKPEISQILVGLSALLSEEGGFEWLANLETFTSTEYEYSRNKALEFLLGRLTDFGAFSFFLTPDDADSLGKQLQEAALAPLLCGRCGKFNAYDASGLCAPCEDEENVQAAVWADSDE